MGNAHSIRDAHSTRYRRHRHGLDNVDSVFVINLESRNDRLHEMNAVLGSLGISKTTSSSDELFSLKSLPFETRRAVNVSSAKLIFLKRREARFVCAMSKCAGLISSGQSRERRNYKNCPLGAAILFMLLLFSSFPCLYEKNQSCIVGGKALQGFGRENQHRCLFVGSGISAEAWSGSLIIIIIITVIATTELC